MATHAKYTKHEVLKEYCGLEDELPSRLSASLNPPELLANFEAIM